jgi:hypothetical protein
MNAKTKYEIVLEIGNKIIIQHHQDIIDLMKDAENGRIDMESSNTMIIPIETSMEFVKKLINSYRPDRD